MPTPRRAAAPARSGVLRWFVIGLGLVILLGGAGLAWVWVGSDVVARGRAREAMAAFAADPAAAPASASEANGRTGDVMGVISIPRLGLTWPIVVGTGHLGRGLGWTIDSSWPGSPGNAVVSGLRLTGGSPLRNFTDLQEGDRIEVRLRGKGAAPTVLAYEVKVAGLTVDRDDSWVLDGVPGHPSAVPTESLLTVITSQDLLASRERSVVFAALVEGA